MTNEWVSIDVIVDSKFVPFDDVIPDGFMHATYEEARQMRRRLRWRQRIRLWWLARRGRPAVAVIRTGKRHLPVYS